MKEYTLYFRYVVVHTIKGVYTVYQVSATGCEMKGVYIHCTRYLTILMAVK